jgi:hypothetical protein
MSAPRKLSAISATLAIFAFAAALFSPALFDGKILAPLDITKTLLAPWSADANGAKPQNQSPSDAVTQYLPYRIFAEKSFKEDGYIGWNPYEMGGTSLAGNTMALPGTWTMQLHRLLPFKDAWNLGIIGEFLVAGTGMLVFLRSRSLPWLACLIGAIAYMANSQFIIWIYHRWALGSFCWMPWVLWSALGTFQWKHLTIRQLLLPGFLAMALLGGSLQHMVFVFLACGCVFLGGIRSLKSAHHSWPSLIMWTSAFCIAAFFTAFSLYPQVIGYLDNIAIGHVRGGIGYEDGPLQPILSLFFIPMQIWPWLVGDPQSINGFKLIKRDYMDLAYLGTIPMLLAFIGVFRKSMPTTAKWLIVIGLVIPLTPLVGPLYHRVQLLFLLGGSWMAAEMIASISTHHLHKSSRWMTIAVAAIGLALLGGTLLPKGIKNSLENKIVTKAVSAAKSSQFGSDRAWIEGRAREWTSRFSITHPRSAWLYSLLAIGTTGLALSTRRTATRTASDISQHQGSWRTTGNIMILTATALELFTLFQTWATYSVPKDFYPPHPAIEQVRNAAGPHRVLQSAEGLAFADIFATPNILAAYSIPSIDAYESIQYQSTQQLLKNSAPETVLNLAGVGLAVHPTSRPAVPGTEQWTMLTESHGYIIRKNPLVPATITAGTNPSPGTPEQILDAVKTAQPITPTHQSMNSWLFPVPESSQWVRIAQNWHQGWQWRTSQNDQWQPTQFGPDSTCWINQIPQGTKSIEVRFFPRPTWVTYTSLTAIAFWLITTLALTRKKKSYSS